MDGLHLDCLEHPVCLMNRTEKVAQLDTV
ncbi:MAG: hypothetical protein JWN15_1055, partial [Firmicutes bacterium]|nr:hypothetical protein [Bacillota bacterium]